MENLLSTLLIASITAYITVRLAISQFHAQKLWEQKHTAYCTIIEALAFFDHYLGDFFDNDYGTRVLTEEQKSELLAEYHQARKTITRYRAIGDFVISEKATNELLSVLAALEDFDNGGDRSGDNVGCAEEIETALENIKKEATNDLKNVRWLSKVPIPEFLKLTKH